jgi:hypothetical protein
MGGEVNAIWEERHGSATTRDGELLPAPTAT